MSYCTIVDLSSVGYGQLEAQILGPISSYTLTKWDQGTRLLGFVKLSLTYANTI